MLGERTEMRPAWMKGYKLRRDRVRRAADWIAQVDAMAEIWKGRKEEEVAADLAGGVEWCGKGVLYFVGALAGWAAEIEVDLREQREKILSIPVQMQKSRLDSWDRSVGRERLAWTVAARELGMLVGEEKGVGWEPEVVWAEAVRLWGRAVKARENRRKVREVGK